MYDAYSSLGQTPFRIRHLYDVAHQCITSFSSVPLRIQADTLVLVVTHLSTSHDPSSFQASDRFKNKCQELSSLVVASVTEIVQICETSALVSGNP